MGPSGWRSGTEPFAATAANEAARAPAPGARVRPQVSAAGASVRFDDVFKSFDDTVVLAGVSLAVEPGEILALLGPSGSGKTTMLRLLAGFEPLDRGRVLISGEAVDHLPPARRGVGMLFQSYALFPHLSVFENVAFGLEVRGGNRDSVEARVAEMLELVRLSGFESRRIAELSGGQQQRVALARALAPRPRVLLLDEPLSNLDPALREETRADLRRTVKQTGITTLLVTHEQEEAFELGERVGVLNGGRLEQVAAPPDLYDQPASRFVASFVGRCSVLAGVVANRRPDGAVGVRIESGAAPRTWLCRAGGSAAKGEAVDVCVRPEALKLEILEVQAVEPESPRHDARDARTPGAPVSRVGGAEAAPGETEAGAQAGEDPGLVGQIESERYTGSHSFYTVRLGSWPPAGRTDDAKPRGHRSAVVEVAMPGRASGLTGACVVRLRSGEPPPRAFPAAEGGAAP